ncbi:nucleoside triphosphate pyrophosphatase [uncultured Gimesia sp.]|uniref:Maf family protein n=1 Tax=uncultured Gimesia sp. TaxID=1678688 RepID=UPI0030DB5E87|tara:strand:- start:236837 stop:237412 length:576 start_codon:yes stop_codon:yes gene_type:complete
MKLILASTSAYRAEQLKRLGLDFEAHDPQVDEALFKQAGFTPETLAEVLALEKAKQVSQQFPDAIVIGGDQLVSFENTILGKPGSVQAAIDQLMSMQGQSHTLITAIAVTGPGFMETHINRTVLKMRQLDKDTIKRYVQFDQPLDCAGAYKLESRGITLFEEIQSTDHSAITGIPLIALTDLLIKAGMTLP